FCSLAPDLATAVLYSLSLHDALPISFLSAVYAPKVIARLGARSSIAISMALLALCMTASPFSRLLAVAVLLYGVMGSARGVSGVAVNTPLMEQVPLYVM